MTLKEALEYKDALTHYANMQNIQVPNLEQWNLINEVCKFLKHCSNTTYIKLRVLIGMLKRFRG